MFAALRRIHQRQDAPPLFSPSPLDLEQPAQLRRTAYDAISLSEHHLVRLHEEREKEIGNGFTILEERAAGQRMKRFFVHILQNHLRAITCEEAVCASLCYKEQTCRSDSERANEASIMASEEDVLQLLWMNRTMALGATYTALEGTVAHHSSSSNNNNSSSSKRPRTLVAAQQQQGENGGTASPRLQETIRFLRATFSALRMVLVEVPASPAASAGVPPNTAMAVAPLVEDVGATRSQGHFCQDDGKAMGFKRQQPEECMNSSVEEPQPYKRSFSFAVKVHEGLFQAGQQQQNGVKHSPGVAHGNSLSLHAPVPTVKHQTTLNLDGRGKLSLAQPVVTVANPPNFTLKPSITAAGSGSGSGATAVVATSSSNSGSGSSSSSGGGGVGGYGAPTVPSQGVLMPSFTITRRPQQAPGAWLATGGTDSLTLGGDTGDAASERHSRRGNRALLTKRQREGRGEEEGSDGAVGSIAGGKGNGGFMTAGEQLVADVRAGRAKPSSIPMQRRTPALGLRRTGFTPPFQQQQRQYSPTPTPPPPPPPPPPVKSDGAGGIIGASVPVGDVMSSICGNQQIPNELKRGAHGSSGNKNSNNKNNGGREGSDVSEHGEFPASLLLPDGSVPPILQPLDPKLVAQVAMEILEHGAGAANVGWDDIAGLEHAKRSVEEAIVWPLRRPDLFVGLRDPPRGLLLFGPPGTGKTMIARAIANRAQCTFLNISASSLISKWMGDGEKLVRCLFAVATVKQPSVIFIDEIDSLLSMRSEGEMDSVRRVKTEFLVQLDGVATDRGDRVLLIGATNRPDELDEAARRRMEKRLYIPLPDASARVELVKRLLHSMDVQYLEQRVGTEANDTGGSVVHSIDEQSIADIAAATDGYSGADIKQVCREAAMGPLREVTLRLTDVALSDLRPIQRRDFMQALKRIRPSVGATEVARYLEWNKQFGSFSPQEDDDCAAEDELKEGME